MMLCLSPTPLPHSCLGSYSGTQPNLFFTWLKIITSTWPLIEDKAEKIHGMKIPEISGKQKTYVKVSSQTATCGTCVTIVLISLKLRQTYCQLVFNFFGTKDNQGSIFQATSLWRSMHCDTIILFCRITYFDSVL